MKEKVAIPAGDISSELGRILGKWNLLNHPFYRAWNEGTLPKKTLATYAEEYGAFVSLLPVGWETLGDAKTSQEELEHAALWGNFAEALGTSVKDAKIGEVQELIKTTKSLFSEPNKALGALYAFEAQQPATAKSKLLGLQTHYELPETANTYFEVHSRNDHEASKLMSRIGELSRDEQKEVVEACETMTEALWNALSGIYKTAAPVN